MIMADKNFTDEMEEMVETKVKETSTVVNNVIQTTSNSNSIGTAGFVLALIGLFLGWIPLIGNILWFLGALFSIIGLFRKPKGLAIAGTVISFIGLIIMTIIVGGIMTMF